MTTDYRAMCAELVAAWDALPWEYDWLGNAIGAHGDLCDDSAVVRARDLLAQPVAEGPTVMEILELHSWLEDEWRANNDGEDLPTLDFARAVLAKWGHLTPQPVAVSERLPRPEDCLDEGWAWFFNKRIGWRQAVLPVSTGYTHWLPANALPTPEATNE
jgi:hypothetical protein